MSFADFGAWFDVSVKSLVAYGLLHWHLHRRFSQLEKLPTNAREIAQKDEK